MYGLTDVQIHSETATDAHVLIAWRAHTILLAFRGTVTKTNVLADLQVGAVSSDSISSAKCLASVIATCTAHWLIACKAPQRCVSRTLTDSTNGSSSTRPVLSRGERHASGIGAVGSAKCLRHDSLGAAQTGLSFGTEACRPGR